jgi:hypothetical protein
MKSALVDYNYDDLVKYSTKRPCVLLLPPSQYEGPKANVDYSKQELVPFLDKICRPSHYMPALTKEQFEHFRRAWFIDCDMAKGKARTEECNALNARIAEEQGLTFHAVKSEQEDKRQFMAKLVSDFSRVVDIKYEYDEEEEQESDEEMYE